MECLQYGEVNFNGKRGKKTGTVCVDQYGIPVMRPRSQANARERDRTHRKSSVNTAFSTLRTLIPTEPKDRKLSKIETLRLASSYISHLGTQLMSGNVDQPCLRLPKFVEENDSSRPHQVCTFCIAHKKSPKSTEEVDFDTLALLGPDSPTMFSSLNESYYWLK